MKKMRSIENDHGQDRAKRLAIDSSFSELCIWTDFQMCEKLTLLVLHGTVCNVKGPCSVIGVRDFRDPSLLPVSHLRSTKMLT